MAASFKMPFAFVLCAGRCYFYLFIYLFLVGWKNTSVLHLNPCRSQTPSDPSFRLHCPGRRRRNAPRSWPEAGAAAWRALSGDIGLWAGALPVALQLGF